MKSHPVGVFVAIGCVYALLGVNQVQAQNNDKRALRQASGVYDGTNSETKSSPVFATGKTKIPFSRNKNKVKAKMTEDAPSTLIGKADGKVKSGAVRRKGKLIVGKTKGDADLIDTATSTSLGTFRGTSTHRTVKRGNKHVGESKAKASSAPEGALTRGFYKGKN